MRVIVLVVMKTDRIPGMRKGVKVRLQAVSGGYARGPHNPKVAGSNPAPATNKIQLNPLETVVFWFSGANRVQPHPTANNPTKRYLRAGFPQDWKPLNRGDRWSRGWVRRCSGIRRSRSPRR